jgi:3-hexulose-6-phosphate synthase
MRIQVALDTIDLDQATEVARLAAGRVDRIEVGTPLLLAHGILAIDAVRAAAPSTRLVADTKTMDYGALHAELVAKHGADGIIVQGAAPDNTLVATCRRAAELGIFVMLDSLGLDDWDRFTARATELSVESMILHAGKDEQKSGVELLSLTGEWSRRNTMAQNLAVAGGISATNVAEIAERYSPEIMIVGEAIWSSADPVAVIDRLHDALDGAVSNAAV